MRRWLRRTSLTIAVLLVACQFVRVDRRNPIADPAQSLYATAGVPKDVRAILERACSDCHSDDTHWPWYSYVAPASWLVAFDVREGREDLSFSEWGRYPRETKEQKLRAICRRVRQGEMPDGKYTLVHRDARLDDADRQAVCRWTEEAQKALVAPPAAVPPH